MFDVDDYGGENDYEDPQTKRITDDGLFGFDTTPDDESVTNSGQL